MARTKSTQGVSRAAGRGRFGFRLGWPFSRRGNRRIKPARSEPTRPSRSGSKNAVSARVAARRARKQRTLRAWLSLGLRACLALCISAGLLAAGYGGCHLLYHSPHFAVKAVHVRGARRVPESSLIARATTEAGVSVVGMNLFSIDLGQVRRSLLGEPWVRSVTVRRELPATLNIEVVEHEPAALVALEALYLVSTEGEIFKRGNPEDYDGLPVLTGIGRAAYQFEPELAREHIRTALGALNRFRQQKTRPPIGEVHMDRFAGVTLYTDKGVAIQLGQGDAELDARLARFDVVWRALHKNGQQPVMLFLDNRAHPDHVTVRLAMTPDPTP